MTKHKPLNVNLCAACIEELADNLHTTPQELIALGVTEVHSAFCDNPNPEWLEEEFGECEVQELGETEKGELLKKIKNFLKTNTEERK